MERKLTKYLILISLMFFTSQIFSQSQIKLLERAYVEESDSLMNVFFNEWKKMTPYQYNNYSDANDTVKIIKEIYKSFYDSLNFFKKDKINLLPNDFKYSVVKYVYFFQWYLDSAFFEIEKDNLRRDTIPCPEIILLSHLEKIKYNKILSNFRPIITNQPVIFLDSLYAGRINSFLVGKFIKSTNLDLMSDLNINSDKYKTRLKFLENYLPLNTSGSRIVTGNGNTFYNQFLNYFNTGTILKIEIDESLNFAIITVKGELSSINYYYLFKNNDDWRIKRKTTMWID